MSAIFALHGATTNANAGLRSSNSSNNNNAYNVNTDGSLNNNNVYNANNCARPALACKYAEIK